MKTKRGQAWGFDIIIAASVFVIGIIFFYMYALNYSSGGDEFGTLNDEGEFIAESLLSEGYPVNWNETNVSKIGILSNDKVNETKLEMFYNLANSNYAFTKSLLNSRNNYYVNFSVPVFINNEQVNAIGLTGENPSQLSRVTRGVVYKDKIVSLTVNVWK